MIQLNYLKIAKEYGYIVGLIVVGLGLVIGGWLTTRRQTKAEPAIVVSSSPSPTPIELPVQKTVVVDIAGEVKRPGVYRLPENTRVAEALVVAGGVTTKANGDYIAKRLNQADRVTDGMKIYIPNMDEVDEPQIVLTTETENKTVSINSSSATELMDLWGVGEVRAKQIMDNRPYGKVEELVSKAGLPQSVLDKNIGKIGL